MAERLSMSGSVATSIQLTAKVACFGYGYMGGMKRAPKHLYDFVDELYSLSRVLIDLQNYFDNHSGSTSQQLLDSPEGPLCGCGHDLELLLKKLQPRGGIGAFMRGAVWPLRANETWQHITRLARYRGLFGLALAADHSVLATGIELYRRGIDLRDPQGYAQDTILAVQSGFESQDLFGKDRSMLDWLYPEDFSAKHTQINEERYENTGEWILNTPGFQCWAQGQGSRILWGQGAAGVGKTFICSAIIEHFALAPPTKHLVASYCVAYFYFDYTKKTRQMPADVLSSLIKQTACQIPYLPREVEELYHKFSSYGARPSTNDLYDTLLPISRSFGRTFFVFDALDECDQDIQRKELLPLLQRMARDGISIFLASHPEPEDIKQAFCYASRIEIIAQDTDIERYIRHKINHHPRAKNVVHIGQCMDKITSELIKYAKGVFLIAHLNVEYLCQQTTTRKILKALEKIKGPPDGHGETSLNSTYERAIETINQQPKTKNLAFNTLSWIVNARGALTVDELLLAVSVQQNTYELDDLDLPDRAVLLDACAGLVAIEKQSVVIKPDTVPRDTIRLAHYTVREYLLEKSVLPEDANFKLAMACTTFLSLDVFSQPNNDWDLTEARLNRYPFLKYAAGALFFHLKKCDMDLSADFFLKFLGSPGNIQSCHEVRAWLKEAGQLHEPISHKLAPLPLHIASELGHSVAVYRLLEAGADISAQDPSGRTALCVAAEAGHEAIIRILLEKGAKISADSFGWTALHTAAEAGHEAVVRVLLEEGADISAVDLKSQTALNIAAGKGHEAVVKILLEKGIEVSAVDSEGRTALHRAAEGGKQEVSRLLLGNGANTSVRDAYHQTALHIAASEGEVAVIKLLLENGATISAQDSNGQTALHRAAYRGYETTVRLLIREGADVSASNSKGETALHRAVMLYRRAPTKQKKAVAEVLLANGACVSAVDLAGNTPLHTASRAGVDTFVSLLLEKGADLSYQNNAGYSALGVARLRYDLVNDLPGIQKVIGLLESAAYEYSFRRRENLRVDTTNFQSMEGWQ